MLSSILALVPNFAQAPILVVLTRNVLAAQEFLRHKNMATTLAFYKKQVPEALTAGMRRLEETAGKKKE